MPLRCRDWKNSLMRVASALAADAASTSSSGVLSRATCRTSSDMTVGWAEER
eukprot:CAMPEP_0175911530 /NCGR_PEP_ID=MMETSP0108-20121206/8241_1 /TAXON_ID=195067 ORGANISM="Goniomonas pacifica, Strain CCMP1869" /NCGR_SAMPLE_ID=MMETSP0108 /ASSEMBLY_ACC=CAM_ASM_000204 /LENGTH=51 /DNA_ID=CAMNT_0017233779 /DNA_START=589 /DNA_END=744 /DNA_ORIENTATION=+